MSEHRPELSRLPWRALGIVARVIASGDAKYADGDWITAPGRVDGRRDLDSALGHIGEWLAGKSIDSESGQSPLAHAAARLLFIVEREALGIRAGDWRVTEDDIRAARQRELVRAAEPPKARGRRRTVHVAGRAGARGPGARSPNGGGR